MCERGRILMPQVKTERLVRQQHFKDGVLDYQFHRRTELVLRWRVRSMQPEVGQEDRKGQENMRPGNLRVFIAVTQANHILLTYQSQLDATRRGYKERLKDGRLENGKELSIQVQSQMAVAVSFFCRTNFSVDFIPRRPPNGTMKNWD
ncbi:hypothetical protein Rcae01_05788 [Novipirellula caenicola]|uniref:Uncharacterized protein n=1 Tax=Novipirellula caenicola TaxID=1536901 RepID=A0ABP9W0F4_9BACT